MDDGASQSDVAMSMVPDSSALQPLRQTTMSSSTDVPSVADGGRRRAELQLDSYPGYDSSCKAMLKSMAVRQWWQVAPLGLFVFALVYFTFACAQLWCGIREGLSFEAAVVKALYMLPWSLITLLTAYLPAAEIVCLVLSILSPTESPRQIWTFFDGSGH